MNNFSAFTGMALARFFQMIDVTASNGFQSAPVLTEKRVFRHTQNERMAGSVPVWAMPQKDTAQLAVAQSFEQALKASQSPSANAPDLLGYMQPETTAQKPEDSFGFGDLLDMVNPLQHIPFLNSLYREISGDTIKPSSRVLGGALFGGPLGAAGSLINVVVEEETGKDITGNTIAFITEGKSPVYKSEIAKSVPGDNPVNNISNALAMNESNAYRDLPASLLAFADPAPLVRRETVQPLHNQQSRYNV